MTHATLGELVNALYEEFLTVYDDEELAALTVAATLNDMFLDGTVAHGHRDVDSYAEADAA